MNNETQKYVEARREWNERYGDYITQAANWRVTALACLGLLAGSLAGNVYQGLQTKTIPYVVAVDDLGRAVGGAYSIKQDANTAERMLRYTLSEYVKDIRGVVVDGALLKEQITRAFVKSSPNVQAYLRDIYGYNQQGLKEGEEPARSPFSIAKTESVTVSITSLLPLAENQWQVEWKETRRNLNMGTVTGEDRFKAILTATTSIPTNDNAARLNPLGIQVQRISIERLN